MLFQHAARSSASMARMQLRRSFTRSYTQESWAVTEVKRIVPNIAFWATLLSVSLGWPFCFVWYQDRVTKKYANLD
ncbi:hypothetical protein TBLA_0F03030 [Henningerozyma blattae CBS 6284]|uniref:Uncharacterized protein n=1 Tax=Henningerozyma blattae (strain ATCC 34711 / CBS 6284 / DSM 70876 / NBRC 10599 / NRRL Y-10934 / UCD 77-7) TaxID=1071380 RepID=I2H640_HENB6|nr:hypothetical protein TBLA_0F03030 [Tetrapisispora blattae CBS 6284]CCH61842.1 hypothetical protein TBLA_0F03030 [Tetrapisispora blattae CBS 6284]